jgi:hypothetical protein
VNIVTVMFQVAVDSPKDAEGIVEERLGLLPVLWQNDGNDAARSVLDPIVTYVVVPATYLLEESI